MRIDYNGKYLYCSVSDNPEDYAGLYDSCEECLLDVLDEVEECCILNEYDEIEIEYMKLYYQIKFQNYEGEWKFIY